MLRKSLKSSSTSGTSSTYRPVPSIVRMDGQIRQKFEAGAYVDHGKVQCQKKITDHQLKLIDVIGQERINQSIKYNTRILFGYLTTANINPSVHPNWSTQGR